MVEGTCGTCLYYSGESCAILIETPMQHRPCPAEWSCPEWAPADDPKTHGPDCLGDCCVLIDRKGRLVNRHTGAEVVIERG